MEVPIDQSCINNFVLLDGFTVLGRARISFQRILEFFPKKTSHFLTILRVSHASVTVVGLLLTLLRLVNI